MKWRRIKWHIARLTQSEVRQVMYHTTDEYNYCDSTPIGEKWPICNLQKGHPNNHESFDYWWETGGPPHAKEIPMPKIPFEKFARESPREWPGGRDKPNAT